jgi:hypothetical protein
MTLLWRSRPAAVHLIIRKRKTSALDSLIIGSTAVVQSYGRLFEAPVAASAGCAGDGQH